MSTIVFDRHGDIAGKDQVGDRVEEDTVFGFEVAGDEGIGQLFGREAGQSRDERVGQFLEVGDFIDDFVLAFLVAGAFGQQVAHFKYVFLAEKALSTPINMSCSSCMLGRCTMSSKSSSPARLGVMRAMPSSGRCTITFFRRPISEST
jgi:hypothetical protein